MSETASANGYQVLERQPWPKSRNTDGDSLCGDYDVLSAFEDYCKEIQKVSINEVSETSSSIPSYTMVSEPYAWEPYSVGLGYNRQSATFKSTNSPHVAYVSLCKLLDPTKKYILIVFLRPPDHESHDPGEPEPTGVWIGTSSGGTSCTVDR